jgi:trigger factor
MKTEFIDVNETRKNLVVEIPSTVVDAEIDKVSRDYGKAARIPGFRPGKVPAKVVRQRFRDQILHDVAHGLIPRAVDEALREKGVEPVDTPDIKDVVVEEGQPLKFTASFDTVPPIDPGDYSTIQLRRASTAVSDAAVEEALNALRDRSARYEPVEGRGVEDGDSVLMDLVRTADADPSESEGGGRKSDTHDNVTVDMGASANPPGFDEQLKGLTAGARKTFDITYPDDYAIKELAGTTVNYDVTVKAVRTRIVPALDDEFAKDTGKADTLDGLRAELRKELEAREREVIDREAREGVLRELIKKNQIPVASSLVERAVEMQYQRLRQMLGMKPERGTPGLTDELRDKMRPAGADEVRGQLLLEAIADKENIAVTDAELTSHIETTAKQRNTPPAKLRAEWQRDGRIDNVTYSLRQDKVLKLLVTNASVTEVDQLTQAGTPVPQAPAHGEEGHVHGPDCDHEH